MDNKICKNVKRKVNPLHIEEIDAMTMDCGGWLDDDDGIVLIES